MPKNKGKGGKNRRRGKNEGFVKRELVEKSEGQEYGQVIRMLGNGRLEAYCFDGKKRLCHIRGKMRKKVWVNQGDIILVSKREFQDDKADIVLRYNADEARLLKKKGALPASIKIEDNPNDQLEEDIAFDFTAGDDDDSDSDSEDEILSQPTNRGMLPPSDSEDSDSDDVNLDEL